MIKISVYTKRENHFVTEFETENIDEGMKKMKNDFGEHHSKMYEIEVERIQKRGV